MTRTRALVGMLGLVVATMGLTSCEHSGSKSGGTAEPVVLTLADGYSDPSFEPAVSYFIKRVAQLSDGKVRVEDKEGWGHLKPAFEQQIVSAVAAGKADMGWVGTRVFDTLGVTSFQALTAPMLIDSYPLEDAVIGSGMPKQMLSGLDALNVTGLAVLGDGLRKPIAQDRPLETVADWRGVSFNAFRSDVQAAAVAATGATPTDDPSGKVPFTAAERNLLIYQHNYVTNYPFVTANVNLWPQTIALIANPHMLAKLSEDQRGWVQRAADESAAGSTAFFDHDQDILAATCAKGARFADATPQTLAALRTSFDGVYGRLEQNAGTKDFIAKIEALKASLPAATPLQIPTNCASSAGEQTAQDPLQGRWESKTLTEGQIVQAFVAAGGSESDGHDFFAQFGGGAEKSVRFRLDFEHGAVDQYESGDGRSFAHGDQRAYSSNGHELAFTAPGCVAKYKIALHQDELRLRGKECSGQDAPYATTIYGSFPYTRIP
jgi:TRAP-type C4-dicarboxylate transport system substrate-binding protein